MPVPDAIETWESRASRAERRTKVSAPESRRKLLLDPSRRIDRGSQASVNLFRRHVGLGQTIDLGASRQIYEELVRAGLMVVSNPFAGGENGVYRVTKEGLERRDAVLGFAKKAV